MKAIETKSRYEKWVDRATSSFWLLLLLTPTAAVQAQFNYTTNNGTITITGYTCSGGALSIPSTINGLPVTRIEVHAFDSCVSLTSVTIPNSVTSIGGWAFNYCPSLTSVTIPDSVTRIGTYAFASCGLTSVTIPNSVTSIGEGAFAYCTSLTAITVDTLNPIYSSVDGVLLNKSQTRLIKCPDGKAGSYTIPNKVTTIGDGAFRYCTSLISVTIPNSVTSIGNGAFYSCTSLTSVMIGNGVITIGEGAFSSCGLTNVTIPDTVTSIGINAFAECRSLSNVTIGNRVASIGDYAFGGCSSLTAIMVVAPNSAYSSVDGVLFNKSLTRLIVCPGGKTGSYTIPNSVISIGDGAFQSCTSLTDVTIPNSVTSIGYRAFADCSSLTSVSMGNGVTNIADYAFISCTSLTEITVEALNPSFSSVDGVLFDKSQTTLIQCPGAKAGSYTVPKSVTTIGFGAFFSSTGLTGIYFQGSAPILLIRSFENGRVFDYATNATVYYLPGTTGWDTAFGGRPTALWKPQVQASDGSFGVRTNQFGFTITWASGLVFVVEACTDLANPIWSPVETSTLTGDSFYFSDPQWTNYPGRFYRLRDNGQTTVPVAAQSGVTAIAAGYGHTVALKSDGSVVAWGDNGHGQTTVPVAAQSEVTAIAAGFAHTVALKNDGWVLVWGRNVEGQTTMPAGLSGVTAIAAGGYHTVALKNDGSVLAWGYNGNGQTSVPVAAQSGVRAIAAGHAHTVALKNDGSVVAWGDNEHGQTTVPVAAQSGVTAIAAGIAHTVALKTDGSVIAWGKNFYGQVTGNPTLADPDSATASPVTLGGQVLGGVTAIAAGGYHTVALKSDGSVVSWGHNGYGQVTGNPTTDSPYTATASPVTLGSQVLSAVTAIAAGAWHTVALRNNNGSAVAWGSNEEGQVTGTPTTTDSPDLQHECRHTGRSGLERGAGF